MKSLLILILSLTFSSSFASIFKHRIDNDIKNVINHRNFRLKKSDLYLAENLNSVYKVINSGYFNEKLISKTYGVLKNNKPFAVFTPWLEGLTKMLKLQKVSELTAFCNSLNQDNSRNLSLVKNLNRSKQIACASRFIDVATKNYNPTKGLSQEAHEYIKQNSPLFVANENLENTAYFLSMLKDKFQYDYLQVSESLSNFYIQNKIVPPEKLLSAIQITPDLTKFIQIYGFGQSATNAIYYREFDLLGSNVFNAGDDEKESEEVIKVTRQFVNYYDLNQEHLPLYQASSRALSVAKSLSRRKYYQSCRMILSSLIKYDKNFKEEAIFEYLWTDIVENKYDDAYKLVNKLQLVEAIDKVKDSQLAFWVGQILLKKKDDRSKDIFQSIITKDPLSYYAVMAAKGLQVNYNMPPDKIFEKYLDENQIKHSLARNQIDEEASLAIIRLKAWSKLDNNLFISYENNDFIDVYSQGLTAGKSDDQKAVATLLISSIFNESNNYLAAFKNIYNGINNKLVGLNFSMLKNLFPRPYYTHIKKYSKGFDPVIALSLIRQESGFDPRARSIVGARGLMQIMPATARRFRSRVKSSHLYNPHTNLQIGTAYFDKLLSKYDNNLVFALSAYNAGETRVHRWKDKYFTDASILTNIENIPFNETRKYVKLIFRNMFFYKLLNSKPEMTDTDDRNKIFGIHLGFNN